ncbi:MAG: enoyl-CoA hydratase/isomerase family protein [Chloroflexi bacterium]|nr:enoyl-CoA hydratase/isomerase family protein [Chloroflexota bacterium]
MAYETILYDVKDRVATITLNRPEKMNALSRKLQEEVVAALKEGEASPEVHCFIIKGAGRCFSAGYDLTPQPRPEGQEHMARRRSITDDIANLRGTVERWQTIWNLRKPVIAQVHGYCLAGGNDLIGVCDIIIAAEDAIFGHPQVRAFGLNMVHTEPFRMGPTRSKYMLLTGFNLSGVEASQWGLATKAVPKEHLEAEVQRIAGAMAQIPPALLEVNKFAVNRAFEIMGIRQATQAAIEFDAIVHFEDSCREFQEMLQREGVTRTLTRRDAPFNDYRTAQRKPR